MATISAPQYVSGALTARGIPHTGLDIMPPGSNPTLPASDWKTTHTRSGQVVVVNGIATADRPTADSIIQYLDLVTQVAKSHYEIFQELQTLTGDQLSRAWNSIASGWPNKLQLDTSTFASTFNLADWLSRTSTAFSPYELDELKQRVLGMYVLSQPYYLLKNPAVGADVAINGWKPA